MRQLPHSIYPPLASLVLLIMGSGLLNTFISIRLEIEGFSPETIGAVASALYIGILVGSLRLDRWIEKVGHISAFIVFAIVSVILVLAQAIWLDPIYWSALRFMCGICTAGVFIVIESWLLMESPSSMRGTVLSLYLAIFYAALSAGQFLINLSNPESLYPFCIAAVLFALSILPISVRKIKEPKIEHNTRLTLIELFRISPVGFFGGLVSGMLLAAIYGLVPVYAKEMGLSVSDIGTLMGVIIFGGLSFQWPAGRWADKTDRRWILTIASLATTLIGIGIAVFSPSLWLLLILGWLFGGFSFTLYPISMAYTCEKITDDQIVSATGGFVLSYGIGAIAGPLIAPIAMSLVGPGGLFYFLALITLVLALICLKPPLDEIA